MRADCDIAVDLLELRFNDPVNNISVILTHERGNEMKGKDEKMASTPELASNEARRKACPEGTQQLKQPRLKRPQWLS